MDIADIKEIATATWRLEKWLDNLNAERKMAAKSALRNIKKYIAACNVEIKDPLGSKFDPGLAVEVVNNENPDIPEEELIIIETLAPYIYQNGELVQYAKVIIGSEIKAAKPNNEIKEEAPDNPVKEEQPEGQNTNELSIKDKIEKLKNLIDNKPSKKSKKMIFVLSSVIVLLLLTNIIMLSFYKHDLSSNIANNSAYSNAGEIAAIKESVNELKKGYQTAEDKFSEIEKAISCNSDKLDKLLNDNNKSVENEVKLQKYTVQKGDSLYSICKAKEIDFSQNISLI